MLKYTSPYLVFVIYYLFFPSSNFLLLHNHVNITVTDFSNMSQLSIQVETYYILAAKTSTFPSLI